MRDREHIAQHGDRCGMTAGAVAAEHHIAAEFTAGDNRILRAMRPRQRRTPRHKHGAHARAYGRAFITFVGKLRLRDLPHGAAEFLRIGEVDRGDLSDGLRGLIIRIEFGVQRQARQNA